MLINSAFSVATSFYNKSGSNVKQDTPPATQANSAAVDVISLSPQAQKIIDGFHEWKSELGGDISSDYRSNIEKSAAGFENIVKKAVAENGYDDPQSFLKTLSSAELKTLQTIHSLADPIEPSVLSKEGALNLLLSRNDARDIDNDGFQNIGIAKTWSFPPANAPESVKNAWKKTTENMSPEQKFNLQSAFLPIVLPGYNNTAFLPTDTDYSRLIKDRIAGYEFSRPYNNSPEQQKHLNKQIAMLDDLLKNLG